LSTDTSLAPKEFAVGRRALASVVLFLLISAGMPGGTQTARVATDARYIVVFRQDVANPRAEAGALARANGLGIRHVYEHALKGFAAVVPAAAVQGLVRNPRVALLELDRPVELAQTLPTGVDRIDADLDATARIDGDPTTGGVNIGIAILDTGVDLDHPDLNVGGGADCVPTDGKESYDDDHGHGTHVAGIAAARDDGGGVVGVAPGAPLWAVKVMPGSGAGSWSDVVCGLDWVAANAGTVRVANMSLTGPAIDADHLPCDDPLASAVHRALCATVAAGVTVVVAAGNQAIDAAGSIPATFDEAIAVSALSDFDGRPGALGSGSYTCSSTAVSRDDGFACFSNYGAAVDLAAPGTAILSTAIGGGTAVKSGTSMASPHVAGAAALYLATHPAASPGAVRSGLISAATATTASLTNLADPDGIDEPILNANLSGSPPPPTATVTPTPTQTATAIPTPTVTPATAPSPTSTPVPTAVPSPTPTPTPLPSPTATPTPVPSPTATPTPPPTATPTATSTAAPSPPVITAVAVDAGKTTATITWTTDLPATSTVRFGIDGAADQTATDGTLTTHHQLVLTGLARRTTYTYVVESTADGLTSARDPATFRTR
jgi:subtilisin